MIQTITRAFKAVLPPPLRVWGRHQYEHACLLTEPVATLDASRLLHRSQLDLQGIMAMRDAAQSWAADGQTLQEFYGNDLVAHGVSPGERRAIYHLIRWFKPQRVLELGTHVGASTLHIAMGMRANGGGKLTTVDIVDVNAPNGPWKTQGKLKAAPRELAQQMGCGDIEFLSMPGRDYMQRSKEQFDFIFLDGDHTSAGVYREVELALRLLTPGGVILLHDYHPHGRPVMAGDNLVPGPYLAMRRVMMENKRIEVVPAGALPWATKLGSTVSPLAVIVQA